MNTISVLSFFFSFFALFICHIEEKKNCEKKRKLKVSTMPITIVASAWNRSQICGETQQSIFSWCYRLCCGCECPLMQINTGQILICWCFIFCVYCNMPVAPKVDSWHSLLVYKKILLYNISQVCLVIPVISFPLLPCLIPTAHSHLVRHFSHELLSYV